MPADGDTRVLSYHDVLLRKSDVDILRGPDWLNDQVCPAVLSLYLVLGSVSRSAG